MPGMPFSTSALRTSSSFSGLMMATISFMCLTTPEVMVLWVESGLSVVDYR